MITLLENLIYALYERPRGLDFSRRSYPYQNGSINIWYERTHRRYIKQMFSQFDDKNLGVLDLGCGKGYLLYQLQKLGFTMTDGVEYFEEFARIAQCNMHQLGLADRVNIFHQPAQDFTNYTPYQIIYMYHPFKAPVMRQVLDHLEQNLADHPRELYVVYLHPMEHHLLDRSPYFERVLSKEVYVADSVMDVYYYYHNPEKKIIKKPSFSRMLHSKLD